MRRRDNILIAVGVVVVLLVALRLALPSILLREVNSRVMALDSYDGHVDDIDLALWRGAYRIDGIRIVKTGAEHSTPFFSADRVDFSVEWRSLMRGRLVAEGTFFRPSVNLISAKNKQEAQLGTEVNWAQRLEELFPFRFNTVKAHDATITFRAPGIRTEDALKAHAVEARVTNLTNVVEVGRETFAEFHVDGRLFGEGTAKIDGRLDPNAPEPTFDVNLTLENTHLPDVNPWLRQYIKADAEAGDFELYLELAAADGAFKGYAKPVMRNVNIYSSEEPEKNPLKRLWEGLVDLASNVLENKETEQVAARIPIAGTIENPRTGIVATIASVLRNAFVAAFARSLEGSISLRDVKKSLQDLGGEGKETKKEQKKEKSPDETGRRDATRRNISRFASTSEGAMHECHV
jgi:hypothetical protein